MKSFGMALAVVLCALAAQGNEIGEFRSAKVTYCRKLTDIYEQRRESLLRTLQDYVTSLRDMEQEYQEEGDLDNLLRVRKERNRFTGNTRPGSIKIVTKPLRLSRLQDEYLRKNRELKEAKSGEMADLVDNHVRHLATLKESLTRSGKIGEAILVSRELERIKESDPLAEAERAFRTKKLNAEEEEDPPPLLIEKPPVIREKPISLGEMRGLLYGDVRSWNPTTREIIVKYNFSRKSQLKNWRGGTINGKGKHLVCDKEVAWLNIAFSSISKIEYRFGFLGDRRARVRIGGRLWGDMIDKAEPECVLLQSEKCRPLVSFFEKFKTGVRNYCSLKIEKKVVKWSVNFRASREGKLLLPILYPTRVGFGLETNKSAYDNIIVSGVLSEEFVNRLRSDQ